MKARPRYQVSVNRTNGPLVLINDLSLIHAQGVSSVVLPSRQSSPFRDTASAPGKDCATSPHTSVVFCSTAIIVMLLKSSREVTSTSTLRGPSPQDERTSLASLAFQDLVPGRTHQTGSRICTPFK